MGTKDGDKSHDITPIGIGGSIRPRSFLDVVSIVENYFLAEKGGNNLPDNLLTFKGKIMISEVGFKGAAISGIVSILLTPLFVGVLEKNVPIFGSSTFSLFDDAFALALAIGFSLGYGLILSTLGRYYIGNLAKRSINWLMLGLTMAGVLKVIVAAIFYNTLYVRLLDNDFAARVLMKLYPHVSYQTLNKIFVMVMEFKPVLLVSSNFVFLSTALMLTVPWIVIFFASKKTKQLIDRERLWA